MLKSPQPLMTPRYYAFLQNLFSYSLSLVAAAAVGHLNDSVILSSVVLAGSLYNVTGNSLIFGMSSGLDTVAGGFGLGDMGGFGALVGAVNSLHSVRIA